MAERNFERARAAFRNAAAAKTIVAMRLQAELGLAFLDEAEALSAVVEACPSGSPRARSETPSR